MHRHACGTSGCQREQVENIFSIARVNIKNKAAMAISNLFYMKHWFTSSA